MAQQLCHCAQIDASLDEPAGKSMAQIVPINIPKLLPLRPPTSAGASSEVGHAPR
jgi:hypothetical protein